MIRAADLGMDPSGVIQQQDFQCHFQAFVGEAAMVCRRYDGIGNQFAGDDELMVGQGGDKLLSAGNRLCSFKPERNGVAVAGEGNTGPGRFGMSDQRGLISGQSQNAARNPVCRGWKPRSGLEGSRF